MDAAVIGLIALCGLAGLALIVGGLLLDRRSHRRESAAWMRNWTVRTRVLSDLFRRWQGTLRLSDQRAEATQQDKPATRRRKRPRKASR